MRVWKRIPGFPNYIVSNTGEVHNIKRKKALHPWPDKTGRLRILLHDRNQRGLFYVHRLVAEAYMPDYIDGIHLRWLDGDYHNNHIDNLAPKAEHPSPRASLTRFATKGRTVQVIETGHIFKNVYACARYINGDPSNIYAVLAGRLRTHRGFSFRYLDEEEL